MIALLMLSFGVSNAQIKNAKTEDVKVYGNCGMCEKTIEKSGNRKNIAEVDWNKNTKMATITYDTKKTNLDEILKRIALSGYDSDKFLAPDDVYTNLHACCLYDRAKKTTAKTETHDHSKHTVKSDKHEINQLKAVFDRYFSVKDALVKNNITTSTAQAAAFSKAIKAVDMTKFSDEAHTVWMKVREDLTTQTEKMVTSKDIDKQRQAFAVLNTNMYELAKVTKLQTPVYYQHCPMYNNGKGANWLSQETDIKNPYYGAQMLTCGSTVDTID